MFREAQGKCGQCRGVAGVRGEGACLVSPFYLFFRLPVAVFAPLPFCGLTQRLKVCNTFFCIFNGRRQTKWRRSWLFFRVVPPSCAPLVLRLGVDLLLLLLLLLSHLVSICGWNVGKGYSAVFAFTVAVCFFVLCSAPCGWCDFNELATCRKSISAACLKCL